MLHSDYVKTIENDPEYLKGKVEMLEEDNTRLQKEIERKKKLINAALSWRQSWPDAEDEQWAREGVNDMVCNLIRACDEYKERGEK